MTKCLTKFNGTFLRLNVEFGTNSLFTLKRRGNGWWNKFGLVGSRLRRCSKALTNRGGLGAFFVEGITCILSGTWKGFAIRLVGVSLGWIGGCPWLVGWGGGGPWLGGFGGLSVVGGGLALFTWRCIRVRGAPPPLSEDASFLLVYSFWRWPDWPSVSNK